MKRAEETQRSNDILPRYRIDGVKPQRAEYVPCAHLPAIFILHKRGQCYIGGECWSLTPDNPFGVLL